MTGVKMLMVFVISMLASVQAAQPQFCSLPSETGPCRAAFMRFYFDSRTQECKQFIYGGCRGNDNNFRSESQCKAACVCTQDLDSGRRCQRPVRRFYYDITDTTCKRFQYNGCDGNGNRFFSRRRCLDACATSICFLPAETGPCRAAFKRYHYNKTSQSCEEFTYGGCQGNANRFTSQGECDRKCTEPISGEEALGHVRSPRAAAGTPVTDIAHRMGPAGPPLDICTLPRDPGPCQAFIVRYFFNSTSEACEPFTYGGCQANENNFATETECRRRCAVNAVDHNNQRNEDCELPPDQGPCEAYMPSFYYNSATGMCEEFIYGGCRGNKNRFPTRRSCIIACGTAAEPYSSIPGGGLSFSISGGEQTIHGERPEPRGPSSIPGGGLAWSRGGRRPCTLNLFSTWTDKIREIVGLPPLGPKSPCEDFPVPMSGKTCFLPPEPGLCLGHIPKYHFNATSGACEEFIYGGCGGNDNRFDSAAECEARCRETGSPPSKDRCFLSPESGSCFGNFPKYHFNATAGACEEFIYGGCGGNDNRFDSVSECEKQCGVAGPPPSDVAGPPHAGLAGPTPSKVVRPAPTSSSRCLLPPETGKCRGYFRKYHFNATSGACEQFIYGGCGGNTNRFDSVARCERICAEIQPPKPTNRCLLPPQTGFCRAYLPRFFYNATSGMCEEFIYGGCRGNTNRFGTEQECMNACQNVTLDN